MNFNKIVWRRLHKKKQSIQTNKIDVLSLLENHKDFLKNNKVILKTQQRFKKT